jgi:hypothetical protein
MSGFSYKPRGGSVVKNSLFVRNFSCEKSSHFFTPKLISEGVLNLETPGHFNPGLDRLKLAFWTAKSGQYE